MTNYQAIRRKNFKQPGNSAKSTV